MAFVLVAGLSAGALAGGSFLLVRDSRLEESQDRAVRQARLNLSFAAEPERLPARPRSIDVTDLIASYVGGDFQTVALSGRESFSSGLPAEDVPPELRAAVERGDLAYQRTAVGRTPYLVVGARVPGRAVQLYFFFSEADLQDGLRQLGTVLLAGWGAVLVVAALVGSTLAKGTLGPVARASLAAHSLAEGLLDTRLPVETNDEFGAWAASFNEMAEALEDKIGDLSEARARERRFTSDVSHELRTPLAALVSEASLLKEHLDRMPPAARRPAELLITDVARLRTLVEDLMEISRLDAGRGDVRLEPVDLGSLTGAAIRARGWDGRVAVHSEEVVVVADRRRLERVVANLVGNALEHGGREVAVRVGRDGTGAFVEVSDRGRGIAPEHLPHLFERFYKADLSRTGPGSGLGLGIALENARLLGGDIDVWSEPGVGTTFTLRLPVTEPLHRGEAVVSPGPDDHVPRTPKGTPT